MMAKKLGLGKKLVSRWTKAVSMVSQMTGGLSSEAQVEDTEPNAQVEDILGLQHLEELLQVFSTHRPRPPPGHRPAPNHSPGKLDISEFKESMAIVLGTHKYDGQLDNLFNKLDISHDNFVDWNEFTTYVLQQLREKDFLTARKFRPFRSEPRIRHVVHNRQEITSKVLYIDSPSRIITVGREGAVSVWSSHLNLETHFEVCDDPDVDRNRKRRVKLWVNDAVYLPNCRKLVVATTGRDLHFYEVTSGQYIEEVHLYGLEDVPCCLDFWYNKKNPTGKCRLFIGDDDGNIHFFNFLQPAMSLFLPSKKNEGPQKVYFPDLVKHSRYVEHSTLEKAHKDMVRQVRYLADNGYILSASTATHHSLVLRDELGKKRTYTFNCSKGVECFAYSKPLNLLVTGSSDHVVRVWNPYVTTRAVAVLTGHAVGIVDVAIHEALKIIVSYSKDAVLKVWDPSEHTCLQTVNIKFPCAVHGPLLDHGVFALCMTASRTGMLLVAAQDYLAHLRLSDSGPETTQSTTHLAQLCAAIYNPNYKQVVTGADDSSMGVWDLETGRKAMMLTECHQHEEITAISFDLKFQRIVTGARDGTIKTWSAQTGQCMQQLEAVAEAEVTGVVALTDRSSFLAVGWSRTISTYDDSNPENTPVSPDTSWRGGQHHKDDILSIAYMPPLLLATGSYDGAICIWSMEKCTLVTQLKAPSENCRHHYKQPRPTTGRKTSRSKCMSDHPRTQNLPVAPSSCNPVVLPVPAITNTVSPPARPNSRPNSRHRTDHRTPKGTPAPADALLFLSSRDRRTEGGLLVSTSGGDIRLWSVYSKRHLVGSFYAPAVSDESVLAICTDPNNRILATGDTAGHVTVWDVSDYCLNSEAQVVRERPRQLSTWLAHDGALVSVEYVHHEITNSELLITASTDRLAKLWTIQGKCIGTFGQIAMLHRPNISYVVLFNVVLFIFLTWVVLFYTRRLRDIDIIGTADDSKSAQHANQEEDQVNPEKEGLQEEPKVTRMQKQDENIISPRVQFIGSSPRSKTGLGLRVEREFERRRSHRLKRRAAALNKDGGQEASGSCFDLQMTSGCKNTQTAFPFHSLDMKPLEDVTIPESLTPRNLTCLRVPRNQRMVPTGSGSSHSNNLEHSQQLSVTNTASSDDGSNHASGGAFSIESVSAANAVGGATITTTITHGGKLLSSSSSTLRSRVNSTSTSTDDAPNQSSRGQKHQQDGDCSNQVLRLPDIRKNHTTVGVPIRMPDRKTALAAPSSAQSGNRQRPLLSAKV